MGKKIVLDTNVLISAFGWKGPPREIFQKCISGELDLFVSPNLLLELKKVLSYPKFDFNSDEIDAFLSIVVETRFTRSGSIALPCLPNNPKWSGLQ